MYRVIVSLAVLAAVALATGATAGNTNAAPVIHRDSPQLTVNHL